MRAKPCHDSHRPRGLHSKATWTRAPAPAPAPAGRLLYQLPPPQPSPGAAPGCTSAPFFSAKSAATPSLVCSTRARSPSGMAGSGVGGRARGSEAGTPVGEGGACGRGGQIQARGRGGTVRRQACSMSHRHPGIVGHRLPPPPHRLSHLPRPPPPTPRSRSSSPPSARLSAASAPALSGMTWLAHTAASV